MTAQTESWFKKLGTDALVLGAVTVLGYAVAYLFEMGIASHYGFPRYLIEPTTATLASSLTFIAVILYGFAPFLMLNNEISPHLEKYFDYKVDMILFVALSALSVIAWAMFLNDWKLMVWIGISVLVYFSMLWLTYRFQNRPVLLLQIKRQKFLFLLCVLVMDVLAGAIALGAYNARQGERYSFLKADPSYAVVRSYGGTMIAMKYDLVNNRFEDEYKLIKLSDDKAGMDFNIRKILRAERPLFHK